MAVGRHTKIALPVLTFPLLLLLPTFWCGDPCPPKEVLGPCTCTCMVTRNEDSGDDGSVSSRLHLQDANPNAAVPSTTDAHRSDIDTPSRIDDSNFGRSLNTIVECNSSRSVTQLEETLKSALHRKMVDKLIVTNIPPLKEHSLSRLPAGCLKNVRIRQFEIRDTTLSGDFIWKENPFLGQADTLLWFSAQTCHLYGVLSYEDLGTVNTKGLRELPRIEGVDFSFNLLTVIKSTAFRHPPANLSTVVLAWNNLQVVESASFQYIPRLKHIDLSHNLLESIIRTIFASPAAHLENIDLRWNFLRNLPVDLFVNMPSLKIVNLSKNFLYSLPEKPWAVVWNKLIFIDITNNFIDCDCNLLWLLRLISPANVTTPATLALPGQTVRGICNRHGQMPGFKTTQHELVRLTRKDLMC